MGLICVAQLGPTLAPVRPHMRFRWDTSDGAHMEPMDKQPIWGPHGPHDRMLAGL